MSSQLLDTAPAGFLSERQPGRKHRRIFEPEEHPRGHLIFHLPRLVGDARAAGGQPRVVFAGQDRPAAGCGALVVAGADRLPVRLRERQQRPLQFLEGTLADPFHDRVQFQSARAQQAAKIGLGNGREPLPEQTELRLSEERGRPCREILGQKCPLCWLFGSHGGTY